MFFILLTIGAVNICLGFTLAMFLGYGPPGLSEAWEAFSRVMPRRPAAVMRPPFETTETLAAPTDSFAPLESTVPTESSAPAESAEPEALAGLEVEETLLQELLRTTGEVAAEMGEAEAAEKTN